MPLPSTPCFAPLECCRRVKKLLLINLDSAPEVRDRMVRQLNAQELANRRVGCDGRERSSPDVAHWVRKHFPGITFVPGRLSGAGVGCWLTHMTAWRSMFDAPSIARLPSHRSRRGARRPVWRHQRSDRVDSEFDVVLLGTLSRAVFRHKASCCYGTDCSCIDRSDSFTTPGTTSSRAVTASNFSRAAAVEVVDRPRGGRQGGSPEAAESHRAAYDSRGRPGTRHAVADRAHHLPLRSLKAR